MDRRKFMAGVAGAGVAGVALPGMARTAQAETAAALPRPSGEFPPDRYTPYGYLDNPFHTWNLHRSGVLRSVEAIGFGFYFPAGPGGYFDYADEAKYAGLLRLGFSVNGKVFFDHADFAPEQLYAGYHSHLIFTYRFAADGCEIAATFHQVGEDTLAAEVEIANPGGAAAKVGLLAAHEYHLGAAKWWGRDGIAGRYEASGDAVATRGFAAGTAFRLNLSEPSARHAVSTDAGAARALLAGTSGAGEAVSYYPAPLFAGLACELTIPAGGRKAVSVWLTRATDARGAAAVQRQAKSAAAAELQRKQFQDRMFWGRAAMLEGDWPEHWRRGWVYDIETLRMMVRRPIGDYRHPWDAMQVQAPRNVLAETSIDMWALSYADPGNATAVLLGQYLDALDANVPCMREDGEMNMVAADGDACGTSIGWCYPIFCLQSVARRIGGAPWLPQVAAQVARFVRWTLAHRTDSAGYVVGKCSWETGMDASSRFQIQQPTGAELIDFIRIVELQAATAHACGALAEWSRQLQDAAGEAEWRALQRRYADKTQSLWNGHDWFQDFDTRRDATIVPPPPLKGQLRREVGQAAPIFLGVATAEQARAMLPLLRQYRAHPAYYLEWASLVLPYLESLWTAGERRLAGEVTADLAERIYRSTDRREPGTQGLGWPGVSCEMWGLKGAVGGEGYGWGATLVAHIIRSIAGFRETGDPLTLELSPAIPERLMQPGKRYAISSLQYGDDWLRLSHSVRNDGRIDVEGEWLGGTCCVAFAPAPLHRAGQRFAATVENGSRLLVRLKR
jgi:hypothetical protein